MVVTAEGAEGEPADARCPREAPLAISGGGSSDGKSIIDVIAPITKGSLSHEGERPDGWRVRAETGRYTAYAVCAGTKVRGEEEEEEGEELEETEEEKKRAEELKREEQLKAEGKI